MTSTASLLIEEAKLKLGGTSDSGPKNGASGAPKASASEPAAKPNPLGDIAKSAAGLKVPQEITFSFNPKEFSVSASAQFAGRAQAGNGGGKTEFVGAAPRQMSVTVFLDAAHSKTKVGDDVSTLLQCCNATKKSIDDGKPSPPQVTFKWGWVSSIKWFVESAQAQLKMFDKTGQPIRATVQLTLKETPESAAGQNPTSGGDEIVRNHRVVSGDSLASVAYRTYGDPAMWRRVAEASGVDDPLRVAPGRLLRVPAVNNDGWEG